MGRMRFQHNDLPSLVTFESPTWSKIQNRVQLLPWTPESGGQMFGKIDGWNIVVSEVTGPRRKDVRSRTSFVFDVESANAEIADRFARGSHYLGDWHTHPESSPQPSSQDKQNAARMFKTAGSRPFFLMVIAGGNDSYVALHTAKTFVRLAKIYPSRNRWL
jgi:integrative and conjugative element protein (TIGR02256 family)